MTDAVTGQEMPRAAGHFFIRWLWRGGAVWLALTAIAQYVLLFRFPLSNEAPYLHYIGWLVAEKGYIPYRDIFETSFIGTFLFHACIIKLFGNGDIAFRCVDGMFALLLGIVTWRVMRIFGCRVATGAAFGYALVYFAAGAGMTLQRDYIALLPIATALMLTQQSNHLTIRAVVCGLLCACSALIKPHFLIGAPIVACMLWLEATETTHTVSETSSKTSKLYRILICMAIAGSITMAMPLWWLFCHDGFAPLLEMWLRYMPLYLELDGTHTLMTGNRRLEYTTGNLLMFTIGWWPLVLAGSWRFIKSRRHGTPRQYRWHIALLCLCVLYVLYLLPAGKYWPYHFMPFYYFATLCSSWLLLPSARNSAGSLVTESASAMLFLAFILGLLTPSPTQIAKDLWNFAKAPHINWTPADTLAEELAKRLQAGDTVLPVDTFGPAARTMMKTGALPANRWLEDYPFHHHLDDAYIRQIRSGYLDDIRQHPPRFIIYNEHHIIFSGDNTNSEWPELDQFIDQHYHTFFDSWIGNWRHGYRLLERNDTPNNHPVPR